MYSTQSKNTGSKSITKRATKDKKLHDQLINLAEKEDPELMGRFYEYTKRKYASRWPMFNKDQKIHLARHEMAKNRIPIHSKLGGKQLRKSKKMRKSRRMRKSRKMKKSKKTNKRKTNKRKTHKK
jgi:hypothetical protein